MISRPLQSLYCVECQSTQVFEKQPNGTWKCPVCGKVLRERKR